MKILIAIPCMDQMPVEFERSLLYLEKLGASVCFNPSSLVYDSRNLLSLTAIENGFDRVMWFDSDMAFQPDTLKKLSEDMDVYHADMVTGLYVKRKRPIVPVIYSRLEMPSKDEDGKPQNNIVNYRDYPKNAVFPIKGCGFGCVMTSVKLLKHVWDTYGPAFAPLPWAGEDIAFCFRVNELGYPMYCDSNVSCGHIGTYIYTADDADGGDAT